jgi:hypothetical protein
MNTENKWTKFSDAMPHVAFYAWSKQFGVSDRNDVGDFTDDVGWTHWHPAEPLPEPPREETQAEKDEAAYDEWREAHDTLLFVKVWHAALAWERGEVAKLLDADQSSRGLAAIFDAIRARVGGGK